MGRFINADAFTSTERDMLGYNMFAYCNNNPTNNNDHNGHIMKCFLDAFTETLHQASGYFAVAASVTQFDSPMLGPADVFGAALIFGGALTCASIAIENTLSTTYSANGFSNEREEVDTFAITKESDSPVIFPTEPDDFNPFGLVKIPRAGTKNGAIISWMDPIQNIEVFRWDENPNFSNGAHYHIGGKGHYYPGDIVPEPYATIYFPFK